MIIKIIETKDLNTMVEIEEENFSDPWDFKTLYYEVIHNEKTSFFGAYIEDELVGYIGFWYVLDNIDIINIAISDDFKRQGFGAVLFEYVDHLSRSFEAKTITLEVNVNNLAAINLYKKMDFKVLRTIKSYYHKTDEDAYMMQKEVSYE